MSFSVAVVGSTGAVGERLLSLFEKRKFPIKDLALYASPKSEGQERKVLGKTYLVRKLQADCFTGQDLVFFDASDAVSREWVPQALQSGAFVIDNSSVFRLDPEVPLVIPEINGYLLNPKKQKLFSGPNCVAVPLSLSLAPFQALGRIQRVLVSTYQSTSGAGAQGVNELLDQTRSCLAGRAVTPKVFPRPIAFNCIPQIGRFLEDRFTSEEDKVIQETQKILADPIPVSVTSVRVPTQIGHAMSVYVEMEQKLELKAIWEAFQSQLGVKLEDQYSVNQDVSDTDEVLVGRLRVDRVFNGFHFWAVSDNLGKGAALNAIQMGESLIQKL